MVSVLSVYRWAGSSPLTREKLVDALVTLAVGGLIPAHAGKTLHDPAHRTASTAHPHSRGETGQCGRGPWSAQGSSPLTRGKRGHGGFPTNDPGLIPAHAGKTPPRCPARYQRWAHPRSRGENCRGRGGGPARDGSSPLTRGKHTDRALLIRQERLIPAHAGKTRGRTVPPT